MTPISHSFMIGNIGSRAYVEACNCARTTIQGLQPICLHAAPYSALKCFYGRIAPSNMPRLPSWTRCGIGRSALPTHREQRDLYCPVDQNAVKALWVSLMRAPWLWITRAWWHLKNMPKSRTELASQRETFLLFYSGI